MGKYYFQWKREILSFKITKDGLIDEDDKEMLEDMIMIAIKDAFGKQIEKLKANQVNMLQ